MKNILIPCFVAAILAIGSPAFAQDGFYKGKTIRIVVPFAAGGGYDVYSRIIGRHTRGCLPMP